MITREALRVLTDGFEFCRQLQEITGSMPPGPERDAAIRKLRRARRDAAIAEIDNYMLPGPERDKAKRRMRAIWRER
jgi:hypothetical protein